MAEIEIKNLLDLLISQWEVMHELRCQLLIARDLDYIDSNQYQLFESKILEINRMLGGLLKKLRA